MKLNIFLTIISVSFATLLGYWAFDIANGDENDIACGIGSSICFIACLIPAMGLQYDSSRIGTNIRVFAALFFVIFAISHFCFAGFGVKMPYYIIINGLLLLIYLAILYKMINVENINN